MPRMKSRLALLAALLAALMMTGTLVSTSTATARTSVRPFFYPDPRGDAPRGFDIVRVDGNIDGDTLNVAVKIRGLKRWGMLQVGTNSPDLQNLFQIYRDDYGQVRLAGYHRSAWSPFAKWYVGDDCSTSLAQCAGDLVCDKPSRICRELPSPGEPCEGGYYCHPSALCDYESGLCVARHPNVCRE